jgi:hypothetical protein
VTFWVPWAVDAVVAAIAVYFFFVGVADGSVSSFNIGLWLSILVALAVEVGGSLWLKARGRRGLAVTLLWLLAAPALLAGVFLLIVLITNPRWN